MTETLVVMAMPNNSTNLKRDMQEDEGMPSYYNILIQGLSLD